MVTGAVKKANKEPEMLSSAGHKLGQLIGDWWETKVIFPLLSEVATSLGLYLDNRVVSRSCRSDKVQWSDTEGNFVDYDYVLELGGSASGKGIPVAFLESFWRRGGPPLQRQGAGRHQQAVAYAGHVPDSTVFGHCRMW